jgi:hypothetical protein
MRADLLAGLASNSHSIPRRFVVAFIWGYEKLLANAQKGVSNLNAYGGLFR